MIIGVIAIVWKYSETGNFFGFDMIAFIITVLFLEIFFFLMFLSYRKSYKTYLDFEKYFIQIMTNERKEKKS